MPVLWPSFQVGRTPNSPTGSIPVIDAWSGVSDSRVASFPGAPHSPAHSAHGQFQRR